MELKQLRTTNFKRLGTQDFEFTKGLNFIVGENGEGKTTLLRAIATAMFGIQMLPGHSDDVTTWGSQGHWALQLTFTVEGIDYTLKRSKSTASLETEAGLTANGNTPVTKYMEDLLGMSAKDYNLLIHSRQGETAYVLSYGATALQRKVEEFAGVEIVEKVEREASALANQLKSQLDYLVEPEKTPEQLQVEADDLGFEYADLEVRLGQFSYMETPVAPQVTVRKAQQDYQEYVSSVDAYERASVRRAEVEAEISALVEVAKPEDQSSLQAEAVDLRETIQANAVHNAKVQRNSNLIEQMQKRIDNVIIEELTEEELGATFPDYEPGLQAAKTERVTFALDISGLKKQIAEGKCGTCGSVLHDIDPEEIQAEISLKQEQLLQLDEEIEKLEKLDRENKRYQNQLTNKINKIAADKKALVDCQAELDSIERLTAVDNGTLESDLEKVVAAIGAYQAEVKAYNNYLEAAESLQAKLSRTKLPEILPEVLESSVDEVEAAWAAYQEQLTTYKNQEAKIDNLKLQIKNLFDKITTLVVEKKKAEAFVGKKIALVEDHETAKELSTYLRTKRADYLKGIWDSVMHYSSVFLHSASAGWLEEVAVKDGKFLFREAGAWASAVEASGAQASFLGAALRYGLNKALYRGKTFLAFDEASDSMREDNARNLIAALAGAADQVLVITHRDSDQGIADNIIEV